jgi:hypothetical protein
MAEQEKKKEEKGVTREKRRKRRQVPFSPNHAFAFRTSDADP